MLCFLPLLSYFLTRVVVIPTFLTFVGNTPLLSFVRSRSSFLCIISCGYGALSHDAGTAPPEDVKQNRVSHPPPPCHRQHHHQVPSERSLGEGQQRLGADPLPPVHPGPATNPSRGPQRHQPGPAVDGARLRHVVLPQDLVAQLRGARAAVAARGGPGRAVPVGGARGVGVCQRGRRGATAQGRRG